MQSLSALDLQDTPTGEKGQAPGSNPKNQAEGDREFPPRFSAMEKVFPFPQFFKHQLKAEWAKPMANRQFSSTIKKLYTLPSFAIEMLQVPLEDAPIVALQSSGLLSEDGQVSFHDH